MPNLNEQNRLTKLKQTHIDREQTDSSQRGGGMWGLLERRLRDQSKDIYEEPMDMGNSEGTDYGSGGWLGGWKVKGEKVEQL